MEGVEPALEARQQVEGDDPRRTFRPRRLHGQGGEDGETGESQGDEAASKDVEFDTARRQQGGPAHSPGLPHGSDTTSSSKWILNATCSIEAPDDGREVGNEKAERQGRDEVE